MDFERRYVPTSKLQFIGPAQQRFVSLTEQATYFLDNFWPNWKNYDAPQSYILPPVFEYKNPEVSDEAFKDLQKQNVKRSKRSKCPHEVISERIADEAEHLVYNAVWHLIQKNVQAPFTTVRNLDLHLNFDKDKQLQGLLTKIFPQLHWKEFQNIMKKAFAEETPNAEFDFILIGPKIGIVVIEVKSSSFKHEKHFKKGIKLLPDCYKHGLKQVQAIDALTYLLQETTRVSLVDNCSCVRKILFTPNLKKERYNKWIESLNEADQICVKRRVGDVIQWFEEDMSDGVEEKPPLCSKLQKLLESSFSKINRKAYEAYCPILAAIASITSLSSADSSFKINRLDFSEFDAGLNEHSRIIDQNPLKKPSSKLASCALLKKTRKEVKNVSKIIFLSPDQQKALQGPSRQLIIGAAGTGKTILLQTKAMKCLSEGLSVAVLAAPSYVEQYKQLFDNYGFINYEIRGWSLPILFLKAIQSRCASFPFLAESFDFIENQAKHLVENEGNIFSDHFEWLLNFDSVFIDDALDQAVPGDEWYATLLAVISIMALAQKTSSSKVVWAAVDPHKQHKDFIDYEIVNLFLKYGTEIRDQVLPKEESYFHSTTLRQVMRCSENIFHNTFSKKEFNYLPALLLLPVPGHKIKGVKVETINEHFSTFTQARTAAWEKIKIFLDQSSQRGFELDNLAIILAGNLNTASYWDPLCLRRFLIDKCRSVFPRLKAKSSNDIEDEQILDQYSNRDRTTLTVKVWDEVSSLEWPAVIFVCLAEPSQDRKYERYRAMSRATAMLIDISLTYDRNDIYTI